MLTAIIVAAGASGRMKSETSKILLPVSGKTVIRRAMEAFNRAKSIDHIVVVCRPEDKGSITVEARGITKLSCFAEGGADRQDSVARGVEAAGDCDFVAIHDGARPMITPEQIDLVCADARVYGAATLAVKVKDTIKLGGENGFVESTPNRDRLYQIQTPQVFDRGQYLAALAIANGQGKRFTDDCQLIENAGGKVYLSAGAYTNMKITTPEDIRVAEAIVGENCMRIGHGYDVHRLVKDRKLIIGGIHIPSELGLLGHSDADVLLHAVADAVLGAACLGDIGSMFPDTDPQFLGADSLDLLNTAVEAVRKSGYTVGNIDCTVVAERPKLKAYAGQMCQNIAAACGIAIGAVNVKATTEEGLGLAGKGIAAHAVCIINESTERELLQ